MVLQQPTQRLVAKFVFEHTGFRPAKVSCPSGEQAQAGRAFQCHFRGPDGPYVAYLLITRVSGTRVEYRVQTQRVGATIIPAISERLLSAFVLKHTGHQISNVTCPSGVVPLVGHSYQCHFTGEGGNYTATLTITSVNRGKVNYRIQTRRTE